MLNKEMESPVVTSLEFISDVKFFKFHCHVKLIISYQSIKTHVWIEIVLFNRKISP